jgi:hypothetical protein
MKMAPFERKKKLENNLPGRGVLSWNFITIYGGKGTE